MLEYIRVCFINLIRTRLMSKYIKLYNTTSEQTSDINEGVDKPHVSLSRSEWNIRYIPLEQK